MRGQVDQEGDKPPLKYSQTFVLMPLPGGAGWWVCVATHPQADLVTYMTPAFNTFTNTFTLSHARGCAHELAHSGGSTTTSSASTTANGNRNIPPRGRIRAECVFPGVRAGGAERGTRKASRASALGVAQGLDECWTPCVAGCGKGSHAANVCEVYM